MEVLSLLYSTTIVVASSRSTVLLRRTRCVLVKAPDKLLLAGGYQNCGRSDLALTIGLERYSLQTKTVEQRTHQQASSQANKLLVGSIPVF